MRIINGKYKGKRVSVPKNFKGRPTTSFAKEGLFQLLRNRYSFNELNILDLFAGAGNISYEFLSMEVKSITSVEKNVTYARFLRKQSDKIFPEQLTVITGDAYRYLEKANLNYDVIFADPPYNDKNLNKIPDLALNNPSLKENALLVIEHSENSDFAGHPNLTESRKYGKARFSFFSKEKN